MTQPALRRHVRIVQGETRKALGCGFRLDGTRVLTCWHVVNGKTEGLKVLDSDGEKWKSHDAMVLWPKSPEEQEEARKLDAVILRTSDVGGFEPWVRYLIEGLRKTRTWESHAFLPSASKPEQGDTLGGTAAKFESAHETFRATIKEGLPATERGWKGISGSAILIPSGSHGDDLLIGLLATGLAKFRASRVKAVAMPALVRAAGFKQALGLPDARERCSAFVDKALSLLDQDVAKLLLDLDPRWSESCKAGVEREQVASLMCLEAEPRRVADNLAKAYERLMDDGQVERSEKVFDLLHWVVPSAVLSHEAQDLADRSAVDVSRDVVGEIMVELVNAALDGGPVRLAPRQDSSRDLPRALYRIRVGAETGVDPRGDQKARDAIRQVIERLTQMPAATANDQDRQLLDFIARIGTAPLVPGTVSLLPESFFDEIEPFRESQPENWLEALLAYANQRLADQGLYERRFYFVDDAGDDATRAFIEHLRRKLGELRRFQRSASPLAGKDEVAIVSSFQRVYHRRERGPKQ